MGGKETVGGGRDRRGEGKEAGKSPWSDVCCFVEIEARGIGGRDRGVPSEKKKKGVIDGSGIEKQSRQRDDCGEDATELNELS